MYSNNEKLLKKAEHLERIDEEINAYFSIDKTNSSICYKKDERDECSVFYSVYIGDGNIHIMLYSINEVEEEMLLREITYSELASSSPRYDRMIQSYISDNEM